MKTHIAIATAIVALGLTASAHAQVANATGPDYAQPAHSATQSFSLESLFGGDTVRTGRSVGVTQQEPFAQNTRSYYDRKAPF